MELSFPDLEKKVSDTLEDLQDYVMRYMRRKVQDTLNDWAVRYPRHTFKAWDDYGLLILECSPPLSGMYLAKEERISWASSRHAIAAEAQALEDYWASFDNNISPYLTKTLVGKP